MSPFRFPALTARARKKPNASGAYLRPKSDGSLAHFYTLVTRDTREQEFARNRQTFLTEQGYRYTIRDADDVFEEA